MSRTKKVSLGIFAFICAMAILSGVLSYSPVAFAEEAEKTYMDFYYGSQLNKPEYEVAQIFYNAFLDMDFTKGESYIIDDPKVSEAAAMYAMGDKTLAEQFDAAFGTFYYDQTDYFYLDPNRISLNVNQGKNGYVVTIGGGRAGSYFVDGITKENVGTAVANYNDELDKAVAAVKADLAARNLTEESVQDNTWTWWNAYCTNDFITEKVLYSFCADNNGRDLPEAAFIRTAYGSLVNGKAVCEGYARLFKAIMDKLGFKTVLISGLGIAADGVEPHAWNAVYDETEEGWYGMDCTWNDTSSKLMGKYMMISGDIMSFDHTPNPVVSDYGFELAYPELAQEVYSTPDLDVFWKNAELSALSSNARAAEVWDRVVAISYKGMNHKEALANGLYMAIHQIMDGSDMWFSFQYLENSHPEIFFVDGHYTYYRFYDAQIEKFEIGVLDGPQDYKQPSTGEYTNYTSEFVAAHMLDKTKEIVNPDADPAYVPSAFVKTITATGVDENGRAFTYTDWRTRKQDIADGKMHIKVQYSQKLGKPSEDAVPGIVVSARLQDKDPRTVDIDDALNNSSVENFSCDSENGIVEFDFMPSPLYQHNNIFYTFELTNLQTAQENLQEGQIPVKPDGFGTAYAYADTYICTKCLGGGRYLIENAYSSPVLVSTGDLSTEGWTYKDSDGTTHAVSESQRSNMALVVTKPSSTVEKAAQDGAEAQIEKLNLPESADVSASTYEIDLNICGRIVSIPDGSFVSIKLGFPQGIDYENLEGVVFKLYHFKRNAKGELDYDHPEEIECVVTPYGLVATVQSFSPYTLVTIKNAPEALVAQEAAKKSVTVDLKSESRVGGKISSSTGKLNETLSAGDSITYTLNPYQGFDIEYALVNGRAVKVKDGEIVLGYDELEKTNVLQFGFVARSVKAAEKESGETGLVLQNVAAMQLIEKGEEVTEAVEVVPEITGVVTVVDKQGNAVEKFDVEKGESIPVTPETPSEPDPSEPDPSEPETPSEPDPSEPDPSEPDPSEPDPSEPDPSKPDPSKPDNNDSDKDIDKDNGNGSDKDVGSTPAKDKEGKTVPVGVIIGVSAGAAVIVVIAIGVILILKKKNA